jgi:cbb3-type cytochrome oxidase subunit 3
MGIAPMITVLQTVALLLGYLAIVYFAFSYLKS